MRLPGYGRPNDPLALAATSAGRSSSVGCSSPSSAGSALASSGGVPDPTSTAHLSQASGRLRQQPARLPRGPGDDRSSSLPSPPAWSGRPAAPQADRHRCRRRLRRHRRDLVRRRLGDRAARRRRPGRCSRRPACSPSSCLLVVMNGSCTSVDWTGRIAPTRDRERRRILDRDRRRRPPRGALARLRRRSASPRSTARASRSCSSCRTCASGLRRRRGHSPAPGSASS